MAEVQWVRAVEELSRNNASSSGDSAITWEKSKNLPPYKLMVATLGCMYSAVLLCLLFHNINDSRVTWSKTICLCALPAWLSIFRRNVSWNADIFLVSLLLSCMTQHFPVAFVMHCWYRSCFSRIYIWCKVMNLQTFHHRQLVNISTMFVPLQVKLNCKKKLKSANLIQ